MSQDNVMLQAIALLWDELPDLIGDGWPEFEMQLKPYLQQFETMPDREPMTRALVLHLFSQYENARARLVALMDELEAKSPEERGIIDISVIKGSGDVGPGAVVGPGSIEAESIAGGNIFIGGNVGPGAAIGSGSIEAERIAGGDIIERASSIPPITVRRYTDITCHRRVWVETKRAPVVVRLTVSRPELSEATEELDVRQDLPVLVRIDAPAFDVLNAREQEITVLPNADSAPVVFDLRPKHTGHTHVVLDFFQAGNPIGAASVPVEITAHPVSVEVVEQQQAHPLRRGADGVPPDLVLHIGYERGLPRPELRFTLKRGTETREFAPVPLEGDPEQHVAHLYERLVLLGRNVDPTADLALGKAVTLQKEGVDRRLKQLGQNLWRDLIPGELRDLYAAERDAWRDKTMLIVSDEPYFPWELVWPYDDEEDKTPWCITLRLTRWLHRETNGSANQMPPFRLSMRALACVAPVDSGLLAAQYEQSYLRDLASKHGIRDLSPAPPSWEKVMELLDGGEYDWFHAAAHGDFFAGSPDTGTAIWLEGTESLTPDAFVGPAIERHMRDHHPAFVFNACHTARQGWALAQLGGWANRLTGNGCGLFLAPMWTVSDRPARDFAEAFYERLLGGDTVAETTRQARLAARRDGDPTWLAYSVYAHPNARLEQ